MRIIYSIRKIKSITFGVQIVAFVASLVSCFEALLVAHRARFCVVVGESVSF